MSILVLNLKRVPTRIMILVLPFLLMVMVELLERGSFHELYNWATNHPHFMVLAYFVVGTLYLFLIAVTGRSRLSFWLLCAALLPLGAISGAKIKAIGAPYYPWDLVFHNQIVEYHAFLSQYLNLRIVGYVASFLLLVAILFHFLLRQHPIRFPWMERTVYALITIVMSTSLYMDKPINFTRMYDIYTIPWDQTITYDNNGFLFSSVQMLGFLDVAKPEGYSKKAITSIIDQIPEIKASTDKKPNIIVMLSEAFWDPTIIKNVNFSEDPIPFFQDLQKKYTSGWMLSPQFGGSTANVEFEVLSSNSMRLFGKSPDKILPYIEYMNHGVDSLASITTRQGYTATAINPFFSWFFDSRKVYKHFGFSRFISSEFFPNDFEGPNYADRAVAKKIIEETEKSPGPDFIFANTMENHAPFKPGKFSKTTIEVTGNMTNDSKGMLETYVQGIKDADKCLRTLVEYYSKQSEPTIILFFGDHMPFLDENYKVYRDTKYLLPNDPDFYTKTHSTPFVIWNNFFPADQEKTNLKISPSLLGPTVLHMAGVQGSYYTDYLYNLSQKIPVIPPNDMWDKYNIKASDLSDYAMMQYDNLFGSRYGYETKGYKDTIVKPSYTLGYGDPVIKNVIKQDKKLQIEGSNFFYSCTVYVDGIEFKSSFDGSNTLYADIPEDSAFDPNRQHQVEVRIIDDKKMKIGQSNLFTLQ